MFARKVCYAFVRPKSKYLELVLFLGREVRAPQVRRADRSSKTKIAHTLRITHRDEVEAPITDWMREAYEYSAAPPAAKKAGAKTTAKTVKKPAAKASSAKMLRVVSGYWLKKVAPI